MLIDRGVERAAEDARGAARSRRVRAGHDRSAEGARRRSAAAPSTSSSGSSAPRRSADLLRDIAADAGLDVTPTRPSSRGPPRQRLGPRRALGARPGGRGRRASRTRARSSTTSSRRCATATPARRSSRWPRAVRPGRDPRRLAEEILEHLRNAFLALMAPELVAGRRRRGRAVADQADASAPPRRCGPSRCRRGARQTCASRSTRGQPRGRARPPRPARARHLAGRARRAARAPRAPASRTPHAPGSASRHRGPPPAADAAPSAASGRAPAPRAASARPRRTPHLPPAKAAQGRGAPRRAPVPADAPRRARCRRRDELTHGVGRLDPAQAGAEVAKSVRPPAGSSRSTTTWPCSRCRTRTSSSKAEKYRAEVETALADHFGRRVPLRLVDRRRRRRTARGGDGDGGSAGTTTSPISTAPVETGSDAPEDHLKAAFPGAER